MDNEPDLSFDIDALFTHLVDNLDHDLDVEMDWVFLLRSDNAEKLESAASELGDEFELLVHGEVEDIYSEDDDIEASDPSETLEPGSPMLSVIRRAALGPAEVKAIVDQLTKLAEKHGLIYMGVDCFDPLDEDELFGWMPLSDASDRLQSYTEGGFEREHPMPWTFLVVGQDLSKVQSLAEILRGSVGTELGFADIDVYDEEDEEGFFGLCVFVDGKNNDDSLTQTYSKLEQLAQEHELNLEGIQFFSREDLQDVSDE